MGTDILAFDWYQDRWPWMTLRATVQSRFRWQDDIRWQ